MDLRALDSPLPHNSAPPEKISNPNMMTFGLVIHSLADGLALGASFLPGTGIGLDVGISARESGLGESLGTSGLSLVVFLAIIIHKCKLRFSRPEKIQS
jgi:zinc transporter ZupT